VRSALRLSGEILNELFGVKGVGLEYMLFIARSLELQALPYALNRPPRAAASFNQYGWDEVMGTKTKREQRLCPAHCTAIDQIVRRLR